MLAKGHVMLKDVPGTGKTMLARSIAASVECISIGFSSPDLLPMDITGNNIFNLRSKTLSQPGPIFTHILLADEINRAAPKTQSALLEVMAEGQVTVEGHTHVLMRPSGLGDYEPARPSRNLSFLPRSWTVLVFNYPWGFRRRTRNSICGCALGGAFSSSRSPTRHIKRAFWVGNAWSRACLLGGNQVLHRGFGQPYSFDSVLGSAISASCFDALPDLSGCSDAGTCVCGSGRCPSHGR